MVLKLPKAHGHSPDIAEELLEQLRVRLKFPATYTIAVELVCPKDLSEYGQASWDYLPSRHFQIKLRCDLDGPQMQWVLTHELLEIILSDLFEFTSEEIESHGTRALKKYLDHYHRSLRDSAIEWLTHIILQYPRPLSS